MNGVNHCGAYLEHLQAEHHRLNCALLEIRRQFAELNLGTDRHDAIAGLKERLEDLLRELRGHFAEEEGGGCLEEAVARCPSLGPQMKELVGEHPRLGQALEKLLAAMKDQAANLDVCQEQFETFATNLRTHDCAESQLLQTALGGDAADYDVEGNE